MHEEPFGLAVAEVLLLPPAPLGRRRPSWSRRRRTSTSGIRRRSGGSSAGRCDGRPVRTPATREAGRILRRKGLAGELVLLPLGVDVHRFEPVAHPAPSGALRVGFVGRLIRHKGVDVLLDGRWPSEPRLTSRSSAPGPSSPP